MMRPEMYESGWKRCVARYEQIQLQNAENSQQSMPAIPMSVSVSARRMRLHSKKTTNPSLPFFR